MLKQIFFAGIVAISTPLATQAQPKARNVILFIGDGVGLTSLNAASVFGHGRPQKLFLQKMPHVAWADSSSVSHWVTDAGAAATAIATGKKTANRMVSYVVDERGAVLDASPKTLLELAEARGMSTGTISDASVVNPLVSAFFAHHADRNQIDEIFLQILTPRAGDGVDIVVGSGKTPMSVISGIDSKEMTSRFEQRGYRLSDSLDTLKTGAGKRSVILTDGKFDVSEAVDNTLAQLDRNPKGFFLVVHVDCHLKDVKKSLEQLMALDKIVERVVGKHSKDSLILFTADHSYGVRVEDQKRQKSANYLGQVTLLDDHTGEEVPVLAAGVGSANVKGFVPNTKIHEWIAMALGVGAK
jgi:alkaline phosphatase